MSCSSLPNTRPDDDSRGGLGRRDFLARAAGVGLGLAAGAAGAAAGSAPLEKRNEADGIVYRRLGRTNFAVSALAVGGVVLNQARMPVFEAGVERGLNFVMAHGGACAGALGPWLAHPANRKRIFLGYAGHPRTIDGALKALRTDCIDLMMSPLHTPKAATDPGVAEAFDRAKKAGKARHLCLVFHQNVPAVWKAGLDTGWYDAFLPTYNWPSRKELRPLVEQTKAKGLGLLTMKSLKGLPGNVRPVEAWKRLMADGVDVILKGMTSEKQLDDYLAVARQGEGTAAAAPSDPCPGECTLCGACTPCPQGVAIQDVVRTWQYYGLQLGWWRTARAHYGRIPLAARPDACADCGRCETLCPHAVPVRALMQEARTALA
ncbi:MAG: 4Fe-4S dicluster domain-containing protein [Phycisphaerae bacterium]